MQLVKQTNRTRVSQLHPEEERPNKARLEETHLCGYSKRILSLCNIASLHLEQQSAARIQSHSNSENSLSCCHLSLSEEPANFIGQHHR